jgi:DNA-binding MarR family transcriptional regulator
MSTAEKHEAKLGYSLKRAQHAFRTRVDSELRPLQLTAPQYAILNAVLTDAGISSAALARVAFVTPQTMQGILANMIRAGLLSRSPDPRNKRILRTELTEKGRGILQQAREQVQAIERMLVDAVGVDQAAQFVGMLDRCADALSSA